MQGETRLPISQVNYDMMLEKSGKTKEELDDLFVVAAVPRSIDRPVRYVNRAARRQQEREWKKRRR